MRRAAQSLQAAGIVHLRGVDRLGRKTPQKVLGVRIDIAEKKEKQTKLPNLPWCLVLQYKA